jgi:hypothetical protein
MFKNGDRAQKRERKFAILSSSTSRHPAYLFRADKRELKNNSFFY